MTLGRLATHVAECNLWIHNIITIDVFDFTVHFKPAYTASSTGELLEIFQLHLDKGFAALENATDEEFQRKWVITRGEQVIREASKIVSLRGWAFSHQYHHRGQLSVYLRLLDVPVPGMYGPSADER